jgi:hypothetical protein
MIMKKLEVKTQHKITKTQFVVMGSLVIVGLIFLGWLMNNLTLGGWDFRHNLWAPVSLLVQGKSPYNIKPIAPDGGAVWFPVVIGLFFPLGWISFSYASVLWLVLSISLVVILVIIAANGEKPRILPFSLGLLIIFLHPRVIAHLQLGQYTIFAVISFLLATYVLTKGKLFWTAFFVAIALAKPQLGFLIVPGIAIACFHSGGIKSTAKYISYLIAITVLFSIPLFIGYWNWIPDFISALQQNPGWVQPSLLSVLENRLGTPGILIWFITALIFSFINGWIWYRLPPTDAIYWSLALTPLVTPYIWSWDFVMIMPLFVRTLYQISRIPSYFVLLGGYAVSWWLMFQIIMQTNGDDQYFMWVSWTTFILILVALILENKIKGEQPFLIENFNKV